jgi:hypothetical protein
MKNTLCLALVTLMFLLTHKIGFGQNRQPDSIKVEFEGFNTETFASVTCDAFDHTFLKTKKVKLIRTGEDLIELESLVTNFKYSKEKSLDVRGKVTYYYGMKTSKYCFDVFGAFYKDGRLYYNKKLLIAISEYMYSNHPEYLDTLRYP